MFRVYFIDGRVGGWTGIRGLEVCSSRRIPNLAFKILRLLGLDRWFDNLKSGITSGVPKGRIHNSPGWNVLKGHGILGYRMIHKNMS